MYHADPGWDRLTCDDAVRPVFVPVRRLNGVVKERVEDMNLALVRGVLIGLLFYLASVPLAVADEGVNVGALIEKAATLCGENRYAEAEPLLKQALAAEPDEAEAHYRLAIVYLKTDRPAEAAQEYLETAGLDEKLARDLRMMNPMFSLSAPAKGVATESGYIAAPEPVSPTASDGIETK